MSVTSSCKNKSKLLCTEDPKPCGKNTKFRKKTFGWIPPFFSGYLWVNRDPITLTRDHFECCKAVKT